MKKTIALFLAIVLIVSMFAGCSNNTPDDADDNAKDPVVDNDQPDDSNTPDEPDTPDVPDTYTFQDSVSQLSTNWNPHTYQTTDEAYPLSLIHI